MLIRTSLTIYFWAYSYENFWQVNGRLNTRLEYEMVDALSSKCHYYSVLKTSFPFLYSSWKSTSGNSFWWKCKMLMRSPDISYTNILVSRIETVYQAKQNWFKVDLMNTSCNLRLAISQQVAIIRNSWLSLLFIGFPFKRPDEVEIRTITFK